MILTFFLFNSLKKNEIEKITYIILYYISYLDNNLFQSQMIDVDSRLIIFTL